MKKIALLVVLAASCAQQTGDVGAFWPVASFLKRNTDNVDFGGWKPAALLHQPGARLQYQSAPFTLGPDVVMGDFGNGLNVFPGYAGGEPVAYTISDIWYHTPQPWVQPVYLGMASGVTVFPVDVTGSFYSSFWRAETVSPKCDADSATKVLNCLANGSTLTDGDIILCPIVPAGTTIARAQGDKFPRHPFTGHALTADSTPGKWATSLTTAPAKVDGHDVQYLSFGSWRAQAHGDTLVASKLFVFGHLDGSDFVDLPVPAVLPDDALHDSLMQRVEVTLPDQARAYLPANKADLAPGLFDAGVPLALYSPLESSLDAGIVSGVLVDGGASLPLGIYENDHVLAADPAIDEATAARYMLRIAMNPECFRPGNGFPASCQWLDSSDRIEQFLPDSLVNVENVTLSVGLLPEVP